MLQTFELVALLRDNHLLCLADEDAELLAARMCGYRPAEIAEATFRSERTIRAHLERVLDLICVPAGIKRDPAAATLWALLHAECCGAAVFHHLGLPPLRLPLDALAEDADA